MSCTRDTEQPRTQIEKISSQLRFIVIFKGIGARAGKLRSTGEKRKMGGSAAAWRENKYRAEQSAQRTVSPESRIDCAMTRRIVKKPASTAYRAQSPEVVLTHSPPVMPMNSFLPFSRVLIRTGMVNFGSFMAAAGCGARGSGGVLRRALRVYGSDQGAVLGSEERACGGYLCGQYGNNAGGVLVSTENVFLSIWFVISRRNYCRFSWTTQNE